MTYIMANVIFDVYPSKGKLTIFRDGNYFLIATTFNNYFLQPMLLWVEVDASTILLRNAL